MAALPSTPPSVDHPLSPAARELLGRFDSLWLKGERPSLDYILDHASPDERLPVLIELIHSELEFRLKGGEDARTEEYLQRYPEVGVQLRVVADLIATE